MIKIDIKAKIKDISVFLPENTIDNDYLSEKFPDWSSAKIFQKTGIKKRYVVYANQTPVDLAYGAAMNLFGQGAGAR